MSITWGPRILSGFVAAKPFTAIFEGRLERAAWYAFPRVLTINGLIARGEDGSLRLEYRNRRSPVITIINNAERRMNYVVDRRGNVVSEEPIELGQVVTEITRPDNVPLRFIEDLECYRWETPSLKGWISIELIHVVEEEALDRTGRAFWRMHGIDRRTPSRTLFQP